MQESTYYSGVITETYGVLTITAMTSGTVEQGDAVYDTTDNLLVPQGIMSYISGGLPTCTGGVCSCSGLACVGRVGSFRGRRPSQARRCSTRQTLSRLHQPDRWAERNWARCGLEPNAYIPSATRRVFTAGRRPARRRSSWV